MSVLTPTRIGRDEAADPPPAHALAAVRREFRRSRPSNSSPERWSARRLSAQLPRVALEEALEILLDWRGEERFDAGAVSWHARLCGYAPRLTLDDSARALAALRRIGRDSAETGVLELRAVSAEHGLDAVAGVLDDWLAARQSYGGF
ncbi:MAG TPA: hypothetical protein VFL87_05695 [Thermoleophilaceae bacterium]|nr:hypothetical protein [Thermoleophilaceae bacterium]